MRLTNPSLQHCIWMEEIGSAFIYIPKTACTSWKLFLWQLNGNTLSSEISYSNVHNENTIKLPYVYKMNRNRQEEFVNELNKGKISVCSVVREPYSRVLSGYLDKILKHKNPNSSFSRLIIPEIKRYHDLEDSTAPTFLQFLQWNHEKKGKELLNDHWRPATELLGLHENNDYLDNENVKLWPMTKMNEAADWFKTRFKANIDFPSSQELGTRKTNTSEEQIDRYFGDQEKVVFESIYKQDLSLYQSIMAHQ